MRRIAIINQKGGVGKTTTTVNVGSALARMGHRVLLIDLDPQAHLTLYLGQDPTSGQVGVYEMLTDAATVAKARRKIASNLWACSASIDLAGAEVELVNVVGREVILRDLLDQHLNSNKTPQYDYVLMDCPPSLNVLTLNALCAASEVLIPLQPHYLALQGLSKLLETVALVSKRINPTLKVTGVVVCMNESGTRLAGEVIDDVRSFFAGVRDSGVPWSDTRVFCTVIRRNIKLAESPSYGKSIFEYAPDSHGAKDYLQFAAELHSPATMSATEQPSEPDRSSERQVPTPTAVVEPVVQLAQPEPPTKNRPECPAAPGSGESAKQRPHSVERAVAAHSMKQRRVEKAGIDPALAELTPAKPVSRRPRQPAKRKPAWVSGTTAETQAKPVGESAADSEGVAPSPSSPQPVSPRRIARRKAAKAGGTEDTAKGNVIEGTSAGQSDVDTPAASPPAQPSASTEQTAADAEASRPAQAI